MNELKLEIPEGYEVDIENSYIATGTIKLKKVEKKLPTSIDELPNMSGEYYRINHFGYIERSNPSPHNPACIDFETKEEAEATKTFLKLRKLMNAWNETVEGVIGEENYMLWYDDAGLEVSLSTSKSPFLFITKALAKQFLHTFKKELQLCAKYSLI